jgi:hypothetical protein
MTSSDSQQAPGLDVAESAPVEDTSFLSQYISPRTQKQLKIVLGGVYFVVLSTMVTRRAVARRMKWAKPTYFRQNMHHPEQEFNSGLEAAEAFSVATINVFGWGIFFTGGTMWATDTSGLDEVRQRLRVRLNLTEDDQKGSQQIVQSWLKAANPLNAFKKDDAEITVTETEEQPEVLEPSVTDQSPIQREG